MIPPPADSIKCRFGDEEEIASSRKVTSFSSSLVIKGGSINAGNTKSLTLVSFEGEEGGVLALVSLQSLLMETLGASSSFLFLRLRIRWLNVRSNPRRLGVPAATVDRNDPRRCFVVGDWSAEFVEGA